MCDHHGDMPLGERPADWNTPDAPLPSATPTRRTLVAGAGAAALGTGLVLGSPFSAQASGQGRARRKGQWLIGDHHVHSVFSHDAKYLVETETAKAHEFGVDWMVFTEHSNFVHYEKGAHMAKAALEQMRAKYRNMLIFQGLEWYIPAAEHCTVMVTPGRNDADLLRQFEKQWDGKLNEWEKPSNETERLDWEAKARAALRWLDGERRRRVVDDVLVLANHPLRLGIDSPSEMRGWRDAAPDLVIGMEGAPGAQASAFGTNRDPDYQRGEYENAPRPDSWPGFPVEAYRTRGGFDWASSVVGGMWDSMLAEGLPFWITSNSDHHNEARDTTTVGPYPPGESFDTMGRRPDPVETGEPQGGSDYWPGKFSRNHTFVTRRSYTGVMQALREGRSWVDHGHLVKGVDVEVTGRAGKRGRGGSSRHGHGAEVSATLGGRIRVARGSQVELTVRVTPTDYANAWGFVPKLAHVDVIKGAVTGPVTDRDTWKAPDTRVVESTDVSGSTKPVTLTYRFRADAPFYLRLRGSDGNRHGVGPLGASVDPAGPIPHGGETDAGNPWIDLWFYTNPIFVDVD